MALSNGADSTLLFQSDLVKVDHSAIAELGYILMMALTSKKLTREEFASLLKVANTSAVLEPPAAIPAAHSARLIGLGYMAHLDGRLRMTTTGRYGIAAAENQNRPVPEAVNIIHKKGSLDRGVE
jgi:hypothetical protein